MTLDAMTDEQLQERMAAIDARLAEILGQLSNNMDDLDAGRLTPASANKLSNALNREQRALYREKLALAKLVLSSLEHALHNPSPSNRQYVARAMGWEN